MTRLRKRSAAVLSWVAEVFAEDVLGFEGDVPPKTMLQLIEKLEE
jgi:hypothetical protein